MAILHLTKTEERKHRRLSLEEQIIFGDKVARNRELIALSRAREDWGGFIALHEPRERLQAFQEVQERLTDAEYWQWLGTTWRAFPDKGNRFASVLFTARRPGRFQLMTQEENSYQRNLPDYFMVYSGKGISWRLSKGNPRGSHSVRKTDVLAVFDWGLYCEVIVVPS